MWPNTPPRFTEPPWTLIADGTSIADRAFLHEGVVGPVWTGTVLPLFTTEEAANNHVTPGYQSARFDNLTQFADALHALDAAGVLHHVLINPPQAPIREPEHLPYSIPAVLAAL